MPIYSTALTLEDISIDNRDSETTWLIMPHGVVLEVTKQDLKDLIQNMEDNEA